MDVTDACNSQVVVAVGTASLAGSDSINQRLSRSRALRVATGIAHRMRCETEPHVVALALWAPDAARDDGFRRRLFAFALPLPLGQEPESVVQTWFDSEDSGLPLDVAADPTSYNHIEICVTPIHTCRWRSLRPVNP